MIYATTAPCPEGVYLVGLIIAPGVTQRQRAKDQGVPVKRWLAVRNRAYKRPKVRLRGLRRLRR